MISPQFSTKCTLFITLWIGQFSSCAERSESVNKFTSIWQFHPHWQNIWNFRKIWLGITTVEHSDIRKKRHFFPIFFVEFQAFFPMFFQDLSQSILGFSDQIVSGDSILNYKLSICVTKYTVHLKSAQRISYCSEFPVSKICIFRSALSLTLQCQWNNWKSNCVRSVDIFKGHHAIIVTVTKTSHLIKLSARL